MASDHGGCKRSSCVWGPGVGWGQGWGRGLLCLCGEEALCAAVRQRGWGFLPAWEPCSQPGQPARRCPSQRGAQHWKLPSQMQYLFFLKAGSHMPKLAKCPQVTASSHALSCSPTPAALPHLQQVARAGWDPVPHTRRVLCHCSQVPHRLGTPHLVQPHAQRVPPACPSPRTSPLCPVQPDLLLCAVPVPSRCAPAAGAACSQRPLNTRYQAPARQSYF